MAGQSFWERLFPIKYDFYMLINDQAEATNRSVETLHQWLTSRSEEDYQLVSQQVEMADKCRLDLESKLIAAFATPFDRQDIYSLSVEMGRVAEYTRSTLAEMEAFEVVADTIIGNMVEQLKLGTNYLVKATGWLKEDPRQAQNQIIEIRKANMAINENYRTGMAELFRSADLMHAIKYREVYHHVKDATAYLGYTTDVLHRIIVRMI